MQTQAHDKKPCYTSKKVMRGMPTTDRKGKNKFIANAFACIQRVLRGGQLRFLKNKATLRLTMKKIEHKLTQDETAALKTLIKRAATDAAFRKKCIVSPRKAVQELDHNSSLLKSHPHIQFVEPDSIVIPIGDSLPKELEAISTSLSKHYSKEEITDLKRIIQQAHQDPVFREKCFKDAKAVLKSASKLSSFHTKPIHFVPSETLVIVLQNKPLHADELSSITGGCSCPGIIAAGVVGGIIGVIALGGVLKQSQP